MVRCDRPIFTAAFRSARGNGHHRPPSAGRRHNSQTNDFSYCTELCESGQHRSDESDRTAGERNVNPSGSSRKAAQSPAKLQSVPETGSIPLDENQSTREIPLPEVFQGCWQGQVTHLDSLRALSGQPPGLWITKTYHLCYRRVAQGPFVPHPRHGWCGLQFGAVWRGFEREEHFASSSDQRPQQRDAARLPPLQPA
jgi:hypothetical protein